MIRRLGRVRVVLIVLAAAGLTAWLVLDPGVAPRLVAAFVAADAPWVFALAAVLVLVGHALRAERSRIAIDVAAPSSLRTHFAALSIGYFFTAVLPLRVGELIRVWLLSRRLRIGFLYTFCVIAVERLLDVVLVSGLFLALALFDGSAVSTASVIGAVISLLVAGILVVTLFAVARGRRLLRSLINSLSSFLSSPLRRRVQFSVWTVVYGYRRLRARPALLVRYVAAWLSSWVCYLSATALLVAVVVPGVAPSAFLTATIAPFISASTSLLPATEPSFADPVVSLLVSLGIDVAQAALFATVTWANLTIPIALIGFAWIFFFSVRPQRATGVLESDLPDYANKLDRQGSVGEGLPEFLDGWFRGDGLVHVLHELEVRGDLTLVKVFKGGSNAVTVLSQSDRGPEVKKIVPAQYADKLRMQYTWLEARRDDPRVVTALTEERGDGFYAIGLEYKSSTVPLFDAIHVHSAALGERTIVDVWDYVFRELYGPLERRVDPEGRDTYIDERLVKRVRDAAASHDQLRRLTEASALVVNGIEYENFSSVLRRIRRTPAAWADLADYQHSSAIHGDLTIDNILFDASDDDFVLIDPSDDNQIRGPLLDVARMTQSLRYGYEFLNQDDSPVAVVIEPDGIARVEFADVRSERYARLDEIVTSYMAERLQPSEVRAVTFHAGLFYGRMLSHRIVINPGNAAKYYAVCVVALNEFIDQYPEHT